MDIVSAIKQATAAISGKYFLLPIAGRDQPIRRERVYCYELYHQLRRVLGDSELTVTGEPDKRGRPDFPSLNPDFILHVPGTHRANTAAVEVECRVDHSHLVKDFNNLKTMQRHGYNTLVLLLVANQIVPWSKLNRAAEHVGIDLRNVLVLLHRKAGVAAECQVRTE